MYETKVEMKTKILTQKSELFLVNRIKVNLKILKEVFNIQLK